MTDIVLFLVCCYYGFIDTHTCISPKEWADIVGGWFATTRKARTVGEVTFIMGLSIMTPILTSSVKQVMPEMPMHT